MWLWRCISRFCMVWIRRCISGSIYVKKSIWLKNSWGVNGVDPKKHLWNKFQKIYEVQLKRVWFGEMRRASKDAFLKSEWHFWIFIWCNSLSFFFDVGLGINLLYELEKFFIPINIFCLYKKLDMLTTHALKILKS